MLHIIFWAPIWLMGVLVWISLLFALILGLAIYWDRCRYERIIARTSGLPLPEEIDHK